MLVCPQCSELADVARDDVEPRDHRGGDLAVESRRVGPVDLDDEERARLHAALEESEAQVARGEFVTAEELLASLRPKR